MQIKICAILLLGKRTVNFTLTAQRIWWIYRVAANRLAAPSLTCANGAPQFGRHTGLPQILSFNISTGINCFHTYGTGRRQNKISLEDGEVEICKLAFSDRPHWAFLKHHPWTGYFTAKATAGYGSVQRSQYVLSNWQRIASDAANRFLASTAWNGTRHIRRAPFYKRKPEDTWLKHWNWLPPLQVP